MEQFASLRLNSIQRILDDNQFENAIQELEYTKYDIRAKQEDAPETTHCISAIRYIIERSTGIILPKVYIGDFCREIYSSHTYLEPSIFPLSDHQRGDLVFFMRKSNFHKVYMITHTGIFLDDEGNFFHSNWPKGGQIDTISRFLRKGNIATCKILSNYTDPRRRK